eukprot:TRINITY_DN38429_c0_g1_i1.p1 TRINITY_DN38429_c0_g1~~TRINITY_DN38429_c0_g1_i1.p1  ORF type:complete len:293 (+),score=0.93 TRINITY_DN38429_c0_g1_i1:250-1128(+)
MACAGKAWAFLAVLATAFVSTEGVSRNLLSAATKLSYCTGSSDAVPKYSINPEYLWLSDPYGPYITQSSLAACVADCNNRDDCAGFVMVNPDGATFSCQSRQTIRTIGNPTGPGVASYVRCKSGGSTYVPSSVSMSLPPGYGPCPFYQSDWTCKTSCPSNDAVATGAIKQQSSYHPGSITVPGALWDTSSWSSSYTGPGMQVGIGDCCKLCEAGQCEQVPNCFLWQWVQTDPNDSSIGACTLYSDYSICGAKYSGSLKVDKFYNATVKNSYAFGHCGPEDDWGVHGPDPLYY